VSGKRAKTRYVPEKKLKVYDLNTGENIGLLANFSSEGIMLVSPEKIPSSIDLKLKIQLRQPILNNHEILIGATCCWSRKNISKRRWESGFKIKAAGINKELLQYLSIAFVVGKWKITGVMDVKTIPVEDLRKTIRYTVKDQYPVFHQHSYHEIGKLVNLSIDGSSLLTPNLVKEGIFLNCRVKLPETIFQREYLIFDAECMWSKKDELTGWYRSGLKLQNVSEHDRVIIYHLILFYLEEQKTTQPIRVVR